MTVENTGALIIPQLQSTIVQLRAECEGLKGAQLAWFESESALRLQRDGLREINDTLMARVQVLEEALKGILPKWETEYEAALRKQDETIKDMESQNDMYGWNLHQGLRFGAIEMDLAIRRVLKTTNQQALDGKGKP